MKRVEVPAEVLERDGLCACGCGGRTPIAMHTARGNYKGYPCRMMRGHGPAASRRKERVRGKRYWVVSVPGGHPMADKYNRVPEHRLVMSKMLGRPLLPSETVHHINGDGHDNRPENLQLRQGNHGPGARFKCHDCGSDNVSAVEI